MFEEEYGNTTPVQDMLAYFVTGKVVISDYMVDEQELIISRTLFMLLMKITQSVSSLNIMKRKLQSMTVTTV